MKVCPSCMAEFAGGEVFCPVDGARLTTPSRVPPPAQDPLVGDTLSDRYRVLRPIGEGGMGVVYEAEHVLIEKRVAIKVLRADFSEREDVVERFRQEAKSASRIGHEHIVDISDFGETPDGRSYFVMEYLEGEDLASLLEREGTVSPDRAIRIALQCCRALGAAHRKGIVHRDMKPENVFLVRREDAQDFVKLVDFGIAKMSEIDAGGTPGRRLTKTGMIFGTPEYMSPEQAAGKDLDHRVDVYALGIILYEMIAGRVPFVGDSFMAVLRQHMFEQLPRFEDVNTGVRVSADLDAVIRRALAKEPDARFATMEGFAEQLSTVLDWSETPGTDPGVADPLTPRVAEAPRAAPALPRIQPSDPPPVPSAGRRPPRGVVVGAAIGLLAVLGMATWLFVRGKPAGAPARGGEASALAEAPAMAEGGGPAGDTEDEAAPDAGNLASADGTRGEPPSDGASTDDEPASVAVTVRTEPSGARVVVTGHGEVCASTPCTFHASSGEPLELEARRGRRIARRSVEPTGPTELSLRLVAPQRTSTARSSPPQRAEEAQSPSTAEPSPEAQGPQVDQAANDTHEADAPGAEPPPPEDAPPAEPPPDDLKVPDLFR